MGFWRRPFGKKNAHCYRCGEKLTDVTPPDVTGIAFYRCPACGSSYAQAPGKALHDRWLMPLTLATYDLIFSSNPDEKMDDIYQQMIEKGEDFVQLLLSHIEEELKDPKQNLADMHPFEFLDDAQLRAFLGALARRLSEHIAKSAG